MHSDDWKRKTSCTDLVILALNDQTLLHKVTRLYWKSTEAEHSRHQKKLNHMVCSVGLVWFNITISQLFV